MSIPWIVVLWSGFLSTTLAAAFFAALRAWNITEFSPSLQLGCLLFRDPRHPAAEAVGLVMLFLLGSTLLPAVYFLLMASWGEPSWRSGVLLGSIHGGIFLLILPLLGTISACVRTGYLSPPGWLGLRWGMATPIGVMVGHIAYGALVGAMLAAFSRGPG